MKFCASLFRKNKQISSASAAKERLKIMVTHQSSQQLGRDIRLLTRDLLEVIQRHTRLPKERVHINLSKKSLKLTLELP